MVYDGFAELQMVYATAGDNMMVVTRSAAENAKNPLVM
jgi:hypothetical protein